MSDEHETREYASPPCFAHEVDRDYMGLTATGESVLALQTLLEGERAGARITRESLQQARELGQADELLALITDIQADETRYCSMLIGQIRRLGAEPSQEVGAFYNKCMALPDLAQRFELLNRGQAWVVRKINELLPQLDDPVLIDALIEMRETHENNIEYAARAFEQEG